MNTLLIAFDITQFLNTPTLLAIGGVAALLFPKLKPAITALLAMLPKAGPADPTVATTIATASATDGQARSAAWQLLEAHVSSLKCEKAKAIADEALTKLAPIVLRKCDYQPPAEKPAT